MDILDSTLDSVGKHVIRTETLKERILNHVTLECGNRETNECAIAGLGQVIQHALSSRGYRMVRRGLFVNLDRCADVYYLKAMLDNAEVNAGDRQEIVKVIKKKLEGQSFMRAGADGELEIVLPMSEEEFAVHLEADAV